MSMPVTLANDKADDTCAMFLTFIVFANRCRLTYTSFQFDDAFCNRHVHCMYTSFRFHLIAHETSSMYQFFIAIKN